MTKVIRQSSLKTNIIISTFYKVLKMLSMFITTPHISRALGVAGVGTYSFINSIVTWFVLFAQLGTLVYGSLEIAKVRDVIKERSKVFYEVEFLTVFTSIISLFSWILYTYFFIGGDTNYVLFSVVIIASMFDISWFFKCIYNYFN